MARGRGDDLDRLLIRQRRLLIAGATLMKSMSARRRPNRADLIQARLIAADLRQTLAALKALGTETGAALGQATVGRAASLAYLQVGRAGGRLH